MTLYHVIVQRNPDGVWLCVVTCPTYVAARELARQLTGEYNATFHVVAWTE